LFRAIPWIGDQKDSVKQLCESLGFNAIFAEGAFFGVVQDADSSAHSSGSVPVPREVMHLDPALLATCEVLVGTIPPDWLACATNAKWVQAASAGVERYLLPGVLPKGAILTNASGAFGVTIAEHMICGLIMLYRNMQVYQKHQSEHLWKPEPAWKTISGSRITVVGLGDLGGEFAKRAHALGAEITVVRRNVSDKPNWVSAVYPQGKLTEAVKNADVVALCVPDTADTKRMMSREIIDSLQSDAVIMNVGRGSAIDELALIDALSEKRIAGAVLDVFAQEPLPQDNPLWSFPNVILTPHVSGRDIDPHNMKIICNLITENIKRYANGEPLRNIVDSARGY
jgi:phosphoglycerate dehydrogenase-like enzyme